MIGVAGVFGVLGIFFVWKKKDRIDNWRLEDAIDEDDSFQVQTLGVEAVVVGLCRFGILWVQLWYDRVYSALDALRNEC